MHYGIHFVSPASHGLFRYMTVRSNGGLNQMRAGVSLHLVFFLYTGNSLTNNIFPISVVSLF